MEFDEEPLPDQGFTRRVMARVERYRRRRRIAFAIAMIIAAAIAFAVRPSFAAPGIELIAGGLILTTICSFAWIETENGSI